MADEQRVNILMVDDRPDNLLDLEVILGDLGHRLVRATSGQDALRQLLNEEFAVILLDIAMPLMDGFETARYIRARAKNQSTPIIFVTAYDDDMKHKLEGYALGAVDYITKPISREVLRAKVAVFAELYRKNLELQRLNEQLRSRADAELRAKNQELEREIAERRQAEQRLAHLAHHDPLTGLPNRTLLLDRLRQAIAHAHRNKRCVGLLFMDLDRFKTINDTLGHHIGDRLLRVVAQRLIEQVRADDTVARLGGDEFVAVLANLVESADASRVAEKILTAVGVACHLDRHELHPTPSIGISIYPEHGNDPATLIRNADNAMYRAKASGRNCCVVFSDEMAVAENERLALEASLYGALERGEFRLGYQPQNDLATGRLMGVEALLRWWHPRHGILKPDKFLFIAEETGLILAIGEWVLNTACQELKTWREAGVPVPKVAVNFSATQFRQSDLSAVVERALAASGLEATALEIEVTESALMQSTEATIATLGKLKALGVGLAVDDFGTGYSSLSYLKSFPISKLKIDRSFVQDVTDDADDRAIVGAVIALAKSLGLGVIAEGVRTREQAALLHDMGCDEGQGDLYGSDLKVGEELLRQTVSMRSK
jgi:diguanylate cyclase (GGDEF)-like protein